jgi:hypothetical protein
LRHRSQKLAPMRSKAAASLAEALFGDFRRSELH